MKVVGTCGGSPREWFQAFTEGSGLLHSVDDCGSCLRRIDGFNSTSGEECAQVMADQVGNNIELLTAELELSVGTYCSQNWPSGAGSTEAETALAW